MSLVYKQKYYHYCNGRYAVAGVHQRTIWLNTYDESIAHKIKKVFCSKLTLMVVDLNQFSNFTDTLIDSEVCLNWQVPYLSEIDLISASLIYNHHTETHIKNYPGELVNSIGASLLTQNQNLELQDQIFFYKKIIESVDVTTNNSISNEFYSAVDRIFLTELSISKIEEEICHISKKYIKDIPVTCARVLLLMNKFYE